MVDGTKGFLRGGQYAICLALIQHGKVDFGILSCPNLPTGDQSSVGCLFYAEKHFGAFTV
jgi:3'(2'), 5'-bisphosphate nucleotidase